MDPKDFILTYRSKSCNLHLPEHFSLLPSYGMRNDATANERIKKFCYINRELFTHNE
jgi:hypothetical protein